MVFHEGELAVQTRAGVKIMAQRIGQGIRPAMPAVAQSFVEDQRFAVVASVDAQGRVWASALAGAPGFLSAPDAHTVQIQTQPISGDPLFDNLRENDHLGLIAIDFVTRQRVRLNGRAKRHTQGLTLHVEQVYSNCPKYISIRAPLEHEPIAATSQQTHVLSDSQQRWITDADTFFIASAHETGADASHRGGTPGFVRLLSSTQLEFPDYTGNMMFNTLGNLEANPHAGLIFFDFTSGSTLQLTGTTRIFWEGERVESFPKAERVIVFDIDDVIEITHAIPFEFTFLKASPFHPPLEG